MLATDLRSIFNGLLNLTLLAGAALYAGLVLVNYRAEGSHLRPRVDLHDPAHSAQRLAVWMGVRTLALGVRMATPVFGMLSDASADVGEWFLGHSRHETR